MCYHIHISTTILMTEVMMRHKNQLDLSAEDPYPVGSAACLPNAEKRG